MASGLGYVNQRWYRFVAQYYHFDTTVRRNIETVLGS